MIWSKQASDSCFVVPNILTLEKQGLLVVILEYRVISFLLLTGFEAVRKSATSGSVLFHYSLMFCSTLLSYQKSRKR